jgi:hypothetical protein
MSNELALNLYKKYKGKVNSGPSSGKTYYKGFASPDSIKLRGETQKIRIMTYPFLFDTLRHWMANDLSIFSAKSLAEIDSVVMYQE